MISMSVVVQYLDVLPDGRFDTTGNARAQCPFCGQEITGRGFMNAVPNALRSHVALEHNTTASLL